MPVLSPPNSSLYLQKCKTVSNCKQIFNFSFQIRVMYVYFFTATIINPIGTSNVTALWKSAFYNNMCTTFGNINFTERVHTGNNRANIKLKEEIFLIEWNTTPRSRPWLVVEFLLRAINNVCITVENSFKLFSIPSVKGLVFWGSMLDQKLSSVNGLIAEKNQPKYSWTLFTTKGEMDESGYARSMPTTRKSGQADLHSQIYTHITHTFIIINQLKLPSGKPCFLITNTDQTGHIVCHHLAGYFLLMVMEQRNISIS